MSSVFDKLTKEDLIELAMLNNGRLFAKLPIKFKKLHPDAMAPIRATEGAAGWDLSAVASVPVAIKDNIVFYIRYHTGIAVEIPPGYVGLLFPRSSVYKTGMALSNSVGVIDSDYRGEICFVFDNLLLGEKYTDGDRIGQIVIVPCPDVEMVEVEELSETERGEGGFGSTGR